MGDIQSEGGGRLLQKGEVGKMRLIVISLIFSAGTAFSQPLPSLNFVSEKTTVSGVSSGGFMAVQLQVAFSATISGAGIIAGGPFDCADKSIWRALYVCMTPSFIKPNPDASITKMHALADQELIDPVENILEDRVYLFHGQADKTVARATMDALEKTYLSIGLPDEAINYSTDVNAGHGFVTEQSSILCSETRTNFLIDCDLDQAGDILRWLYGNLQGPVPQRSEQLLSLDQSRYSEKARGMDSVAYAYVPIACEAGEVCRLHIALHGCNQGREVIGEDYVWLTGYNGWAEANNIVVLYPQAIKVRSNWHDWFGDNPNGCWDWWGYSGSDYLSRSAPQISAIMRMAADLGLALQ